MAFGDQIYRQQKKAPILLGIEAFSFLFQEVWF
jgi:hypothetical protein